MIPNLFKALFESSSEEEDVQRRPERVERRHDEQLVSNSSAAVQRRPERVERRHDEQLVASSISSGSSAAVQRRLERVGDGGDGIGMGTGVGVGVGDGVGDGVGVGRGVGVGVGTGVGVGEGNSDCALLKLLNDESSSDDDNVHRRPERVESRQAALGSSSSGTVQRRPERVERDNTFNSDSFFQRRPERVDDCVGTGMGGSEDDCVGAGVGGGVGDGDGGDGGGDGRSTMYSLHHARGARSRSRRRPRPPPSASAGYIGFSEFCRLNPSPPERFSVVDLPQDLKHEAAMRLRAVHGTAGMSLDLMPVHSLVRHVERHARRVLEQTPHQFFKWGVCSKPADRLRQYWRESGGLMRSMKVLWCTADLFALNRVEGNLIFEFDKVAGCENKRRGADKMCNPETPPWFLYLVYR